MKIIVNVDDAGVHPGVARAVETLANKGVVTSTSLVANGPDVEGAAGLDCIGLGVHLDILRGRPVGHWQDRKTLVDENGMFLGSPTQLFKRYVMGKLDHGHVEKEWAAQIERVLDLGVKPTHLTSQGHVHAWPTLTRMAGDLATRYNIRWIRKPEECSELTRLDIGGLQTKFLKVCGLFSRDTEEVSWPDLIWGIADQGSALQPESFLEYMKRSKEKLEVVDIVEICCRPGLMSAGDPPISNVYGPTNISATWRAEFESLSNPAWLDVFAELGADMVGFGDLD